MEKVKEFGLIIVDIVRAYPKGTLIVWGVSLVAVVVLMWG